MLVLLFKCGQSNPKITNAGILDRLSYNVKAIQQQNLTEISVKVKYAQTF